MPVEKFQDISATTPAPSSQDKADNLRTAFELSELSVKLSRGINLPGVRRFRSIEEASRALIGPK